MLFTCWLRNVLRVTAACTFSTSQLQKCSEPVHILTSECASRRATAQRPKVLYPRGVFYLQTRRAPQSRTLLNISTSKVGSQLRPVQHFHAFSLLTPASRNNGVQFLISHPATWLPTKALASFFDLQEPQNIGTTQRFGTFLSSRAFWSSFYWLFLFSDFFSFDSFSSLTLPISAFPSAHIVGSLTFKFPSILMYLT